MNLSDPLSLLYDAYSRHKLRGASPGVLNQFRVTLGNLALFLGRGAILSDLTDETVLDAMYWLIGRGRKPGTANKLRCNVLAMWRWACRRGWIHEWPDAEKMQDPERAPIAWTRDELRRLWQVCESQPGKIGVVPAGAWWNALHSVLWDTSERVTAARSILRSDVSLDTSVLVIRGETRKGKTRDRVHRLHETTVALLRSIWLPERDDLFPWPYVAQYLWIKYDRMLKKAGMPSDRAHKFHCIRKSVASYYEAAGGNATELLDHSSRAVTVRHYTRSENRRDREAGVRCAVPTGERRRLTPATFSRVRRWGRSDPSTSAPARRGGEGIS